MFTVRLRQKFQSESTAIEEILYTGEPLAILEWLAGTKVDGVGSTSERSTDVINGILNS